MNKESLKKLFLRYDTESTLVLYVLTALFVLSTVLFRARIIPELAMIVVFILMFVTCIYKAVSRTVTGQVKVIDKAFFLFVLDMFKSVKFPAGKTIGKVPGRTPDSNKENSKPAISAPSDMEDSEAEKESAEAASDIEDKEEAQTDSKPEAKNDEEKVADPAGKEDSESVSAPAGKENQSLAKKVETEVDKKTSGASALNVILAFVVGIAIIFIFLEGITANASIFLKVFSACMAIGTIPVIVLSVFYKKCFSLMFKLWIAVALPFKVCLLLTAGLPDFYMFCWFPMVACFSVIYDYCAQYFNAD